MSARISILPIVALVIFSRCSFDTVAGGSSEIGNGRIAGALSITDNGTPAPNASIKLIPINHLPFGSTDTHAIYSGITNDFGHYAIDSIESGIYNLEAVSSNGFYRIIIGNIQVDSGSNVPLGTIQMRTPGTLKIPLPEELRETRAIIFMRGTSYYRNSASLVRIADTVVLDLLPAGIKLPSIRAVQDSLSTFERVLIDSPVAKEIINQYPNWSTRTILHLYTEGRLYTADSYNFPLLVRLQEPAFDFSSCAPNGEDIRCSDHNGKILPCEIEYFDKLKKTAAIWVLYDSLDGNSDNQGVIIYSGNPNVQAPEQGHVFDTANGHSGVWHFGDTKGAPGELTFKDATWFHNHGADSVGSPAVTGQIGFGQSFDGELDKVVAGFASPVSDSLLTISAWVKLASIADTTTRTILSITDSNSEVGIELAYNLSSLILKGKAFADTMGSVTWDTEWHYVTATVEQGTVALYFDGKEVAGPEEIVERLPTFNWSFVVIGANEQGRGLIGAIDEVRIEHVARTIEWARMNYESQTPDFSIFR